LNQKEGQLTALKEHHAQVRVLVYVSQASELYATKERFVELFRLGCRGFVFSNESALLQKAVAEIANGNFWLRPDILGEVLSRLADQGTLAGTGDGHNGTRGRKPLSPRELEVVALVVQGYKNKEIAQKMSISEQTVKNHMHNIFETLGVSGRLEVALYAIDKGMHQSEQRGGPAMDLPTPAKVKPHFDPPKGEEYRFPNITGYECRGKITRKGTSVDFRGTLVAVTSRNEPAGGKKTFIFRIDITDHVGQKFTASCNCEVKIDWPPERNDKKLLFSITGKVITVTPGGQVAVILRKHEYWMAGLPKPQ
jgi:DNA-binding NarL/FixJ family response regulator